jgi:tRNA A37 threonylcarbamoyladenosine synthetase subunit TsaC/SUA5/YrdC
MAAAHRNERPAPSAATIIEETSMTPSSDPRAGDEAFDAIADGRAIHAAATSGGIGIFRADVGYAIVGHTEPAIRRIYEAKQRSFNKPCGMFGSTAMFDEVIEIGEAGRDFVRAVIDDHGLPLSIVAPFRASHPLFANVAPFVMANSTKAGTIDLLMNAGATHDEIARLALESHKPVFGSSANRSLTGSKFRFDDIEPEVRAVATVALDRGRCKYRNDHGLGSTIIDLRDFKPVRVGIVFAEIQMIAMRSFGIEIPDQAKVA